MINSKSYRVDNISKKMCTGCSACFNLCPVDAISMVPDLEGFLYPEINNDKCVNCGKCYDNCPVIDRLITKNETYSPKLYFAILKDTETRNSSSSGGAFTALALATLSYSGYVAGVVYDENYKSVHNILINSENQLDRMRRSKLVQSDKRRCFTEILKLLESDKKVLFSGTPCEIAGLKKFLRKDYNGLTTVDIICGCVSSPKVYQRYIESMEEKHRSQVTSVNFKDKSNGWKDRRIAIDFQNGMRYVNSTMDDPYIVSFHSRFNIRPSCFNCLYRGTTRVSDITIGDFWGVNYINSNWDDNKGTSFCLINSEKGNALFEATLDIMDVELCNCDLDEYGKLYNVSLLRSPQEPNHNLRKSFYTDVDRMNFDQLFDKYLLKIREERKQRKKEYFKNLEKNNALEEKSNSR